MSSPFWGDGKARTEGKPTEGKPTVGSGIGDKEIGAVPTASNELGPREPKKNLRLPLNQQERCTTGDLPRKV